MESRGWFVLVTHGSKFQSGLPDLWCGHKNHGQRWVELKNPTAYHFTPAQLVTFKKISEVGVGIWVLLAATEDEYNKLWRPPNWWTYL